MLKIDEIKVSVNITQFAELNNKRFYFKNGIVSFPYSHPLFLDLRKDKKDYK